MRSIGVFLLDKITSFCKRETRKKSSVGVAITLLYRLLSSAVFQCMVNAFFAFYASAYAIKKQTLNWGGGCDLFWCFADYWNDKSISL